MRATEEVVEISTGVDAIHGRYHRFNTKLGQGAFKTVYKAFDTVEQIDVAWNCIDLSSINSNIEREKIFKECDILRKLQHPHILRIGDKWYNETDNHLNFITNIVHDGSLSKYFRNRSINVLRIKTIAKQILSALVYLHSNNIIHRDLKGDNIFIEGNTGNVVIGDLGLSCNAMSARSIVGTPYYMAPELFQEEYNELVDIWSFGMVILELVTQQMPYSECKGAFQAYQSITSGKKPDILSLIANNYVRYFIDICLNRMAVLRPTAMELLDHPFLTSDRISDKILCHKCMRDKNERYREPLMQSQSQSPKNKKRTEEKVVVEGIDTADHQIYTISMKIYANSFCDQIMSVSFDYDSLMDNPQSVSMEMMKALKLNQEFGHKIENAIINAIVKAKLSEATEQISDISDVGEVKRALSRESEKLRAKQETEVWLKEHGLSELCATFNRESLTMEHCRDITDDIIKEMCDQFGWNIVTRLKLKKAVADITPKVRKSENEDLKRINNEQTLLLDTLNRKHQIVSLDIKQIGDVINCLEQSTTQCNKGIVQNCHAMIGLIEQYRDKLLIQIGTLKKERKESLQWILNRLNELNDTIQCAHTLCEETMTDHDLSPTSKLTNIQEIIAQSQEKEQDIVTLFTDETRAMDASNYKLLLNLKLHRFIECVQGSMTLQFDENRSFQLMFNNVNSDPRQKKKKKKQKRVVKIDEIKLDFNENKFVFNDKMHMGQVKEETTSAQSLSVHNGTCGDHRRSQSVNDVIQNNHYNEYALKRRKTQMQQQYDALLVDGYIRKHCEAQHVSHVIYSVCWSLYHVRSELVKFSKIYKSSDGWRLYDAQTYIKRLKVSATEDDPHDHGDDGEEHKNRNYKWILCDIIGIAHDIVCWRIWIRNPNRGLIVIGVCKQRMFKSGDEHKRLVYGIGVARNRWYPINTHCNHNEIDFSQYHGTQCQIDMKLDCIQRELSFCIVNKARIHNNNNNNNNEAIIRSLPNINGWVPYFNAHKDSVGSQLKIALCPISCFIPGLIMSAFLCNALRQRASGSLSYMHHIQIVRHSSVLHTHHCYYFNSSPTKVYTEQELNKDVSDAVLRKRLIFRCKNRGIKELDLLLGNWAIKHVNTLSADECNQLQTILNEESLDLVNFLIKREQVPDNLNNSVLKMIVQWRDAGNVVGYRK